MPYWHRERLAIKYSHTGGYKQYTFAAYCMPILGMSCSSAISIHAWVFFAYDCISILNRPVLRKLQCTLECKWLILCTLGYHGATQWLRAGENWNRTGKTLLKQPHTGMPQEKLIWNFPTLGCHWRIYNFCSLHWNTTEGTVTAHTCPDKAD